MEGIHVLRNRNILMFNFILKIRIDKGEVKVEYFPSHLMLVDNFTYLLMGAKLCELRNEIME